MKKNICVSGFKAWRYKQCGREERGRPGVPLGLLEMTDRRAAALCEDQSEGLDPPDVVLRRRQRRSLVHLCFCVELSQEVERVVQQAEGRRFTIHQIHCEVSTKAL